MPFSQSSASRQSTEHWPKNTLCATFTKEASVSTEVISATTQTIRKKKLPVLTALLNVA